jgi:antitoxin component of RelBE/YafQ-DinJ toxin-antitoxin module
MSTTTIQLETDTEIREKAEKVAEEFGFGKLTTLLNVFLRQVARTGNVNLNLGEEPTEYLLEELKKSEDDFKAGRSIAFNSGQEAADFVNSLITDEKYKKRKQPDH